MESGSRHTSAVYHTMIYTPYCRPDIQLACNLPRSQTFSDYSAPRAKLLALSYELALHFQACVRIPEANKSMRQEINLKARYMAILLETWLPNGLWLTIR